MWRDVQMSGVWFVDPASAPSDAGVSRFTRSRICWTWCVLEGGRKAKFCAFHSCADSRVGIPNGETTRGVR